jgi:hypothetical protein
MKKLVPRCDKWLSFGGDSVAKWLDNSIIKRELLFSQQKIENQRQIFALHGCCAAQVDF